MQNIKVLNNSRYHDEDLQDIVDLFVANNPKRSFRWGTDKYYDLNNFAVVFSEASFSEASFYLGQNRTPERMVVGRSAWKSPHRIRLLNVDKLIQNPVEALTAAAGSDGYLTAGHKMAAQIYHTLEARFPNNGRFARANDDVVSVVEAAGQNRGKPYRVRYRNGTKRRVSNASREVDFQHNARLKQSNMQYRAEQAFRGLAKLAYESEQLLKLTKGRTEGLNFDPNSVRKIVEQLYGNTIPLVQSYMEKRQ